MPFKISYLGDSGIGVLSGAENAKLNCLFNLLAISLGLQIFVPPSRSWVTECLPELTDDAYHQG